MINFSCILQHKLYYNIPVIDTSLKCSRGQVSIIRFYTSCVISSLKFSLFWCISLLTALNWFTCLLTGEPTPLRSLEVSNLCWSLDDCHGKISHLLGSKWCCTDITYSPDILVYCPMNVITYVVPLVYIKSSVFPG